MSYLEINANTRVEINNLILHSFNKQVLQSSIARHGRVLNRFRAALKNLSLVRFEAECESTTAHAVWGEQPI